MLLIFYGVTPHNLKILSTCSQGCQEQNILGNCRGEKKINHSTIEQAPLGIEPNIEISTLYHTRGARRLRFTYRT